MASGKIKQVFLEGVDLVLMRGSPGSPQLLYFPCLSPGRVIPFFLLPFFAPPDHFGCQENIWILAYLSGHRDCWGMVLFIKNRSHYDDVSLDAVTSVQQVHCLWRHSWPVLWPAQHIPTEWNAFNRESLRILHSASVHYNFFIRSNWNVQCTATHSNSKFSLWSAGLIKVTGYHMCMGPHGKFITFTLIHVISTGGKCGT